MKTGQRRSAGFSVVEVLVVLVVLLIGILAIARLFPGGFLTIQRTGEQTGAQGLVAQQIEAQKNLPSVSEGILAVLPDAQGNLIPQNNIHPDTLTDYTAANRPPNVAAGQEYFFSNANIYRYVKGEVVRIPIATPNPDNGAFGAPYMLQMGPVENQFTSVNGVPTDRILVYGPVMERIIQSSQSSAFGPPAMPDIQNEAQYAIDFDRLQIAFYPRAASPARPAPNNFRRFVFQYDYYADDGNGGTIVRTVLNREILVPDVDTQGDPENLRPIWQPIFDTVNNPLPPDFVAFRRDSEEVSRRFRLVLAQPVLNRDNTVNAPPVWTDDPYEYCWYTPQEINNANVGVLLFNPLGRTTNIRTSTGTRAFEARVDYQTFDNHIIREDRQVPNQAPYDIKLSLPFVLTQGEAMDNQQIYNGIFCGDGTNTNLAQSPSILIYNANTGFPAGNLTGRCDPNALNTNNPDRGRVRFTLEPRTGTVRLLAEDVEANGLRSANLRFFYRVQKDWAMQILKANARYVQAPAPNQMNYRSFYVGGSVQGVGVATRIYFPISEAGKTVVLGEYWVRTNLVGTPGEFKRFAGETYQITDRRVEFDPTLNLPYIDLTTLHPEAATEAWQLTAAQTGLAVNNVQGASLKARVIWRGSTQRTTEADGTTSFTARWRKLENETIIMPAPVR